MKIINISLSVAVCVLATQLSIGQTKKVAPKPVNTPKKMLNTEKEKLSYAIGLSIAQNMKQQGIGNSISSSVISMALEDVFKGNKPLLSMDEAQNVIQTFFAAEQAKKSAEQAKNAGPNEAAGKAFLEENKKRAGVMVTPSGLQYEILKEGNGEKPAPTDEVTTHYHGTLISGEVFDSSVDRGQPATFPVNGVIQGWQEALPMMKTGSKWKLFVPSNLAYGNQGAGAKIGPGTTLIFEVELISINKK